MTHEELRIAADTVLNIENEVICEGDESRAVLFKILSDKNLTPTSRNNLKQIAFPQLYGSSRDNMIAYVSGRGAGGTRYLNALKQRSEGRLHTYVKLYGTSHHYISTKIKKGAGKGKYRLQKIKNKPENSIDNLNWLS